MSQTVLIVAAHTDDEALGCGGTIARHVEQGDVVHTLFLTDGVGARGEADAEARERRAASEAALDVLGATSMVQLDFPDNRLDTVALLDVVQQIETIAHNIRPGLVYTHHAGDLNIDHRVCHQAVLTAFRTTPDQSVRTLLAFEVCSSTEWAYGAFPGFRPQRFVDISATLEKKMMALDAYHREMRSFPHVRSPESVRALAAWRGATAGVKAAEAFEIIRDVI